MRSISRSRRGIAVVLALAAAALVWSGGVQAAGDGEEKRVFTTPNGIRPLVHEHPGRHYVAPPQRNYRRGVDPFIPPDYYEAPPPATEKYQGSAGQPPSGQQSPGMVNPGGSGIRGGRTLSPIN